MENYYFPILPSHKFVFPFSWGWMMMGLPAVPRGERTQVSPEQD